MDFFPVCTFCCIFLCFSALTKAADSNVVTVDLSSDTGDQYNLNLIKADESVLHPNIKVISLRRNEDEQIALDSWTPSKRELEAVENIYIDERNVAAVRFGPSENGEKELLQGVVDGRVLKRNSKGNVELSEPNNLNQSDYIDIGRTITPNRKKQGGRVNAVVEVALICDKEFGDIFQHNRQKILEYFTVYFWDMNLRYKTLPGSNISFRITSIVVISNPGGQPFIEEARASDGRAEFGRILERFSFWMYQQMSSLPKFDIAVAITNTQLEWGGGLAYYRAACAIDNNSRRHYGTLVFNDDGAWGSATVGAHEIGHSVGAPHDDDENAFPGGCKDRGYIMSGGNDDLKWFFSTCSNRVITEFIGSNEAACLRRIDEPASPVISPEFNSILAPSMEEQCKRRLKNPSAFVPEEDKNNCKVMKCWVPSDGGWLIWSLPPVENTICKDGRCFRGRCRKEGSLIRNVGSGKCMRDTDEFKHMTIIQMVDCIRSDAGTPLDRFAITTKSNGKLLATPWNTPDAKENGDKCVWTGNSEGDTLWTDRCNEQNTWHGWDFIDVGNGEFMISHRVTKRCAKPSGNNIGSFADCNRNDPLFRWKLQ